MAGMMVILVAALAAQEVCGRVEARSGRGHGANDVCRQGLVADTRIVGAGDLDFPPYSC